MLSMHGSFFQGLRTTQYNLGIFQTHVDKPPHATKHKNQIKDNNEISINIQNSEYNIYNLLFVTKTVEVNK